jgi:hypothetical protein
MPDIVAPGGFSLTGAGTLTLGSITAAAGSVTVSANGTIIFTDIVSGTAPAPAGIGTTAIDDFVSLISLSGAIQGNSISASGSVMLDAATTIVFTTIDSGGAAQLSAGGDITGQHIASASGDVTIQTANGSFHVADLKATELNLTSNGTLTFNNLAVANLLTISAPKFDIHVVNTGIGPLAINAGGRNGGIASTGTLSVDSPGGVVFGNYSVANGTILTTAERVVIQNGHITGVVTLVTPDAVLLINNTSPTPQPGYSAQLFAPGYNLGLIQDGKTTLTNAYVTGFDSTHTATVTNFTDEHTDSNPFVTGVALIRDLTRFLGGNIWNESHRNARADDDPEIFLVPGMLMPIDTAFVPVLATPLGAVPVNLVRN